MKMLVIIGMLSTAALGSGPEVVLVDEEDHEELPDNLTFPPYLHKRELWSSSENGFCCEGENWFAGVGEVNVSAVSGTRVLIDRLSFVRAQGPGVSSSIYIPIPNKYHPLEKATFRAWVYIDELESSNAHGFVVLGISQNGNVGVIWDDNFTVKVQQWDAAEVIAFHDPGNWEKWQIDYNFVSRTVRITRNDDVIGTYPFSPGIIDQPALFFLNSAMGFSEGSGGGRNVSFYDDVYASVIPLCDPATGDCNTNGIADSCDVDPDLGGLSGDCNFNLIPDDCEVDCDGDGIPDDCETQQDADGDGVLNCLDGCPNDPDKQTGGVCGCGVPDVNSDGDEKFDCQEICIDDPNKFFPGSCGCGIPDSDSDLDAVVDCVDECDVDPNKIAPGVCGCNVADIDSDNDGTPDCIDNCSSDPNKTEPGIAGCSVPDTDTDNDGTIDVADNCPSDPNKTEPGIAGCGKSDGDKDGDGVVDFFDDCPEEAGTQADGCNPLAVMQDADEDGVIDDDDDCLETAANAAVGEDGCELAFGTQGATPNMCGTCGTVGMISWSMIFLGFVGMKNMRNSGK